MSKAQQHDLDVALVALINNAGPPVTVRQTYYMAIGAGLVGKTENDYRKVIRRLGSLREDGHLPWDWIADNTRWVRRARQYSGLGDAISQWQLLYRRDQWEHQPHRVELWVESDSIASFVSDINYRYGLPMYVCKGQASKTYIKEAADDAREAGKDLRILYVGDWDPSGLQIDASLAERYGRYGSGVQVDLQRIAVTPAHIIELDLISTPAKRSDRNYARFVDRCHDGGVPVAAVETEALPPHLLRGLVEDAISDQIDPDRWALIKEYERQEKQTLTQLLDLVAEAGDA